MEETATIETMSMETIRDILSEDEKQGFDAPFATHTWKHWIDMQCTIVKCLTRYQRAVEMHQATTAVMVSSICRKWPPKCSKKLLHGLAWKNVNKTGHLEGRFLIMVIDMQDTQPLPVFVRPRYGEETREERFRRIKRFSEITGVRYCIAYNRDEEQRRKSLSKRGLTTKMLQQR